MTAADEFPPDPAEPIDMPGARTQPNDEIAEQSVLGAMLLSPAAVDDVTAILGPDDYYRPRHSVIHEAILALRAAGEPADPTTVRGYLLRHGLIAQAGGAAYLHTVYAGTPTAANAVYYARIVAELAGQRRLIAVGTRTVQLGYAAEGGDLASLVGAAKAELDGVLDLGRGDVTDINTVADAALRQIQTGRKVTPTPWSELNDVIDGWAPATFVAVGARPSVGKTLVTAQALREFVLRQRSLDGLGGIYFTHEMSSERLYTRELAGLARVSQKAMQRAQVSPAEWERIQRADATLRSLPMVFEGASGWTPSQVVARARKANRKHRIGMIAIDHIGLSTADKPRPNRQMELSDAADAYLALAHDLDCTVVVATQLNRGPMQRSDSRPVPSDIRDTDRIEQNADLVLLLHRDMDKAPDRMFMGVAKNRDGEQIAVELEFDGPRAEVRDVTWTPSGPLGVSEYDDGRYQ